MEGLFTKTLQRVLSGLLVLTLSLSLIPTEVFAVQSEDTQPGLLETSWPALVEEGEVNRELTAEDVVGEDLSMRGENVKHFRLLDGTRLAVQYDDAVHYQDTDGKWADIDNSLQLQKINGQVLETEMAVGIDVLDTAMEKLQIGSYAESIQTEAQPAQADEEIVGEDLKHPDAQDSDDQTSPLPATQEDQTVASETQEPVAQEENPNGENQQTGNQQADLSAENPVESVLPVDQFVQIGAQTITTEEAEILSDVQLSAKENGTFDVSYAIGSGLGQEMAVRYKQYRAGFTLHDASLRPAEILESSISDPGSLIEAISPENLSSSIEYTDVQSGVDLVYTTLSGAVKEMIVVKSQQDSYTYVFDLALDNLKPEQNEDGSISLLDLRTDEEIYLIPAPNAHVP